jgi:hypothetical protein
VAAATGVRQFTDQVIRNALDGYRLAWRINKAAKITPAFPFAALLWPAHTADPACGRKTAG